MKTPPKFATEADMCTAFLAWVKASAGEYRYGVQCPAWTPYAETAGWDILLVAPDGTQVGVQAKLKFNLKVLDQCLPSSWGSWREEGPDFRAILVPDADSSAEGLCRALGLILFRPRGRLYERGGEGLEDWEFMPGLDLEDHNGGWHYWSPERRHALPDFVPDVQAGASGPVQLTKWKVAALRIVARLELAGHVTKADFREIGVDPRRWVGPQGWLLTTDTPGQFVAGPGLNLAQQHPGVYPQVLAAERDKLAARAPAQKPLIPESTPA